MSAIGAELAAGKTDITITGDVAFGSRLLRDADSIRYVTPYLDTRPTFLPVGQDGSIYVRLYFVNRKMPHREISSRLKKRDWMGLLGRVPKNADTTPGRIVRDHRWGVLARKCPGLLHTFDPPKAGRSDGPGPFYMAPNRLRLLKADIDNDGIVDTVLHRLYPRLPGPASVESQDFDKVDFETCGTSEILHTRQRLEIFKWKGTNFIEKYPYSSGDTFISIFRAIPGGIPLNNRKGFVLKYLGLHRVTDYAKTPEKFLIIKQHRQRR